MTEDDAEALAWDESRESGLDDRPRCDPSVFAVSYLGLRLEPSAWCEPHTIGRSIVYPANEAPESIAYFVAHEGGHELVRLTWPKIDPEIEERMASRVGVAIMLPRLRFLRDLDSVGWDLRALRALWPLASPWIIARRIAEVCRGGAVASRWSRRKCIDRVVTTGANAGAGPTPIESHLAQHAIREGADVVADAAEPGPRFRAWIVEDGAIVVCGVEELQAQLARVTPVPPRKRSVR